MSEIELDSPPVAVAMSVQETLRDLGNKVRFTVRVNTDGITHTESLVQPQPAGNCMNWVLGHLLAVYSSVLPMFGATPAIEGARIARYNRGSAPVVDGHDALPFDELLTAWNTTCDRVDAGLAQLPDAQLLQHAPNSPTGNPNETVHSLLFTIMFHQTYHAGQLGVLRRMAGKSGAIK